MKGARILSLAALTVLGAATEANASVVPERAPTYFSLATSGGLQNPGIIVGFNPQPDPPGEPLPSLDLTNPDHLVVTESYGTTFNFVLS